MFCFTKYNITIILSPWDTPNESSTVQTLWFVNFFRIISVFWPRIFASFSHAIENKIVLSALAVHFQSTTLINWGDRWQLCFNFWKYFFFIRLQIDGNLLLFRKFGWICKMFNCWWRRCIHLLMNFFIIINWSLQQFYKHSVICLMILLNTTNLIHDRVLLFMIRKIFFLLNRNNVYAEYSYWRFICGVSI